MSYGQSAAAGPGGLQHEKRGATVPEHRLPKSGKVVETDRVRRNLNQ
jgi:hypothetical protein